MEGDHEAYLLAGEDSDDGDVDGDEPQAEDEVGASGGSEGGRAEHDIALLKRVMALRLLYGRGLPHAR